jgi:DNA-binding LacI/PurR family transcriptional regulator
MEAAGERAQELGYKQEFFWAGDPEHTSGRLDRIFQNRGIEGVLLTRQMVYRSEIPLNLSRYAVVGTSRSLDWTGHDFVTDNHYHAMVRVCQACVERGYTRIGYISVSGLEERLHQRMIGAFLGMKEIFRKSPVRFLPPLGVTDGVAPEVLPWIERTQPDAIITQRAGAVISQLGEKGWQPGRDYGLANPLVLNEDTEISGIQEPMNAIGRTAMDMLHAKLMMREWGAPAFPKAVVLDGPWHEGSTLPWLSKGRQEPVDPSGISA